MLVVLVLGYDFGQLGQQVVQFVFQWLWWIDDGQFGVVEMFGVVDWMYVQFGMQQFWCDVMFQGLVEMFELVFVFDWILDYYYCLVYLFDCFVECSDIML